jgi:predicted CoA-binding protein
VATLPDSVATFLGGRRFAVAGVSRDKMQAANAVFRKLRASGYEVVPVNPNATEVESTRCFPDLRSIPGPLDGLVVAAHPRVAAQLVRECAERGVKHVWFHRSFGQGSVSDDAVREAQARGVNCIVGGCPLMYCEPVDVGHKCIRWLQAFRGRVPR